MAISQKVVKSGFRNLTTRNSLTRRVSGVNASLKRIKSQYSRFAVNSKIGSSGGDLDTSKFKYNQSPVETPDGSTKTFTLPNSDSFETGLIEVFVNGNQKIKDVEWQETGTTQITFIGSYSTNPPTSDETIRFNYIKV